jgi:hypothetical protein
VFEAPDLARRVPSGVLARFVREHRQQPAVAGIEVQVVLVGLPQVGLLEDERHPQRALPEIDRALLRRSDDGDVVEPLDLNLLHDALLGTNDISIVGPDCVGGSLDVRPTAAR